MSTKENIQEEEIKDSENNPQVNENQDIDEVKPTSEELIQQEKDKYLRLFAEFENYKKRTSKERIELFKTASQELMTSLLPIMDV
jgi:molecular chaperone GrpE